MHEVDYVSAVGMSLISVSEIVKIHLLLSHIVTLCGYLHVFDPPKAREFIEQIHYQFNSNIIRISTNDNG